MSPYLMQPAALAIIVVMVLFIAVLMAVSIEDAISGDKPLD